MSTTAAVTATTPLLQVRDLEKSYGRQRALSGVNLDIGRGELVALLGDNGAGKSTLVKVLSGLVRPDRGEISWDGKPVELGSRRDSETLGIETIHQDGALVDSMSITRNIFMGREISKGFGLLDLKRMHAVSRKVLDAVVHIEGIGSPDRLVGGLSGGQKQAVAIARAIHFQRTMLLLDEPTSALAVKATEGLLAYLRMLRSQGTTAVLITHNLHHAQQLCDRFIVMRQGRVVYQATKDETSVDELTRQVVGN